MCFISYNQLKIECNFWQFQQFLAVQTIYHSGGFDPGLEKPLDPDCRNSFVPAPLIFLIL